MKSCLGFTVAVLVFFLSHIECAFRCDYNYSVDARGWFKHFVIPATWFDARLRCSLEGATLVSPTTPEINIEMKKILRNFFSSEIEVFTGIHATISQGDYTTIEGKPVSKIYLSWAENEPDNLNNNEGCLTFNYNGSLADRSCSATRPFICYRSHDLEREVNECGTIDPEYHLDRTTNSCYKFHRTKRTFSRANLACSAEGGHLAVINSNLEARVIRKLFFLNYIIPKDIKDLFKPRIAFIGFTDWNERGDWRTIHGQTLEEAGYSTFGLGEPNNFKGRGEYCGSVYVTGRLNDVSCDVPHEFICEKNPNYPKICYSGIGGVSNIDNDNEYWNSDG